MHEFDFSNDYATPWRRPPKRNPKQRNQYCVQIGRALGNFRTIRLRSSQTKKRKTKSEESKRICGERGAETPLREGDAQTHAGMRDLWTAYGYASAHALNHQRREMVG